LIREAFTCAPALNDISALSLGIRKINLTYLIFARKQAHLTILIMLTIFKGNHQNSAQTLLRSTAQHFEITHAQAKGATTLPGPKMK